MSCTSSFSPKRSPGGHTPLTHFTEDEGGVQHHRDSHRPEASEGWTCSPSPGTKPYHQAEGSFCSPEFLWAGDGGRLKATAGEGRGDKRDHLEVESEAEPEARYGSARCASAVTQGTARTLTSSRWQGPERQCRRRQTMPRTPPHRDWGGRTRTSQGSLSILSEPLCGSGITRLPTPGHCWFTGS